jgi:hypothetical protein
MLIQTHVYVSLAIVQRKMKHQVAAAMPKCFENWCRRFDDLFSRQSQRQGFRMYLGGLLGESDRKNLAQKFAASGQLNLYILLFRLWRLSVPQ